MFRVCTVSRLLACLLVLFVKLSGAKLLPESELTSNCFDFPRQNFDRKNCIRGKYGISPHLMLQAGDDAIDFTLHDLDGNAWNLGDALGKGMPVVLIWGMFTCPAYQGMGTRAPWDKCSYWDQINLVETYKDRATFVHLYGAEPHPIMPGTNFDSGIPIPQYWSATGQQRNYQDRLDMAAKIVGTTHPEQVILPDYLPGNPYSELIQPVWCSYGLGARPVTIVTPDGKVFFQRGWLQTEHVGHAIDNYWAGQPAHGGKDEIDANGGITPLSSVRGGVMVRVPEERPNLGGLSTGVFSP